MKSVRVITTATLLLLLGWTAPAYSRQDQQDKPKEQEKQHEQAKPAEKPEPQARSAGQDQKQATRQPDQQRQKQQDNSKKQEQQIAKGQQDQQRKDQQQRQDKVANQQQAKNAQDQQREQRNNSAKHQQQAKVQQNQQQKQQRASEDQDRRQIAQGQQDSQRGQQQDNRSDQRSSPAYVHQQHVAWQGDRAHNWQTEHRTWQQRGGYNGYRVPDDRFRSYYGQDHGFRIYTLPVIYVGGHRRFQYGGYWFGLNDPWPEYWTNDWYDNDDMYVDYYGGGYYLYNRRYPRDRIAISFYLN